MVLVVRGDEAEEILLRLRGLGEEAALIGHIEQSRDDVEQVRLGNA